jgi:hypothetical protein
MPLNLSLWRQAQSARCDKRVLCLSFESAFQKKAESNHRAAFSCAQAVTQATLKSRGHHETMYARYPPLPTHTIVKYLRASGGLGLNDVYTINEMNKHEGCASIDIENENKTAPCQTSMGCNSDDCVTYMVICGPFISTNLRFFFPFA